MHLVTGDIVCAQPVQGGESASVSIMLWRRAFLAMPYWLRGLQGVLSLIAPSQ